MYLYLDVRCVKQEVRIESVYAYKEGCVCAEAKIQEESRNFEYAGTDHGRELREGCRTFNVAEVETESQAQAFGAVNSYAQFGHCVRSIGVWGSRTHCQAEETGTEGAGIDTIHIPRIVSLARRAEPQRSAAESSRMYRCISRSTTMGIISSRMYWLRIRYVCYACRNLRNLFTE